MNPLKRKFSKEMISDIANVLVERKFREIEDLNKKKRHDLATAIFSTIHKDDLVAMSKLPEGWLSTDSNFRIRTVDSTGERVPCCHVQTKWNWGAQEFRLESEMTSDFTLYLPNAVRVLAKNNCNFIDYPADDPLFQEMLAEWEKAAELRIERQDFQSEMTGLISQAKSFFNLYEQWPEVKPLIEHLEPEIKAKPMPVALLDKDHLNKQLDLPMQAA